MARQGLERAATEAERCNTLKRWEVMYFSQPKITEISIRYYGKHALNICLYRPLWR